ncbi:hypothetical protein EXIGLDRAFT_729990, partial [Exidia glandulosa HHB12029]
MEPLRSFTTKDCVFQLLPQSMKHAPMTIDQYIALIQPGLAEWGKEGEPKIKIEIIDFIESAAGDKAVAHSKAVDSFGPNGVPYNNEYVFMFTFAEENGQKKISHINEFVDSGYFRDFMAAVAAAKET